MATDRRTFSVTLASDQLVLAYTVEGSFYTCPAVLVTAGRNADNENLVDVGASGDTVSVQWRNETALGATSRDDFIDKLKTVVLKSLSLSTPLGRAKKGETVIVRGFNPGSSSGWEVASALTAATFPASAVALRAISTNINDTSAGSAARTILIEGLDASFLPVSESLALSGTSYTGYTTQTFLRVNRVSVVTVGTDQYRNFGLITVEDSGAAVYGSVGQAESAVYGTAYGAGQSQDGLYTVPAGYTAYVLDAGAQSTVAGEWALFTRLVDTSTPPYNPRVLQYRQATAANDGPVHNFDVPIVVPEKTDILLRVNYTAAASALATMVLLPN